jgi:hypothetical protein
MRMAALPQIGEIQPRRASTQNSDAHGNPQSNHMSRMIF